MTNDCYFNKFRNTRIVLYTILGVVLLVSTLFTIPSYIVDIFDKFSEKKYASSAMLCIKAESYESDTRANSNSIDTSGTLADNCAVIFSYSEEMRNIIPGGYSISFSSISDSNVISIKVTGRDPQVCADTANAIRNAAPEVFRKYYVGCEALPFGYPASPPAKPISKFSETSVLIIKSIVGLILVALYTFCIIYIEKNLRKEIKARCGYN